MFLKKIALRKAHEKMEAWDELTESFIPAFFEGRIDLTDRFLSNFNKPTRRRMLFSDNDVVFPPSMVFRHPGTKDVYILGVKRQDALEGQPYLALTICQLVTDTPNGSAGLATITRKLPVGPVSDPGWIVETQLARSYLDMEFRTSATEESTTDLKIENYYAYLPQHVQCEPWDFIALHGRNYRVVDTFADSGLSGLRIDLEPDTRSDFVLHIEGVRDYDRTKQEYVNSSFSYNVTGVMENYHDYALWATDADKYMDVYFEAAHVPFPFPAVPGKAHLELNGVKRTIKSISTQAGRRQYKLRCL